MTVKIKDLLKKVRLNVVYGDEKMLEREITISDISRPGLEMTGYFDYYTPERIQLMGMKEWSYLMKMTSHNRYQVLRKMFERDTVMIVARDLKVPDEMLKAAKENKIVVLSSRTPTSRLSGEISSYLD